MTWGDITAFALGMIVQSSMIVIEARCRDWRLKRQARR